MKPFIRTGLMASAIAFLLTAGIAFTGWNALPESSPLPVHWGADGQDQSASRNAAWAYLLIVPGAVSLISLLLSLAPSLDPRKSNLETGRRAYLAIWIGVLMLLVLLQAGIALAMRGADSEMAASDTMVRLVIAASGALFIVIGNYLPKTRSSFAFGIRTPWTLSSGITWEKTHRLAGPLFMAAGALGMAGAFVFSGIWLALQLTTLVATAATISAVYSYIAWRSASDRDAGSGLTI